MTDPLRVHFFTLTDVTGSEHIYLASLRDALTDGAVVAVDDWREADVVHCFEVNFFTEATIRAFEFPTLVRMLYSSTPVVISTDDLYFIDEPGLTVHPALYRPNHYAQRWLFGQADGIIALSESVRTALSRSLAAEKIQVVHHGVAEEYRVSAVGDREPFVFHVSLASPRKNPEAVLETARNLDCPFRIAGSGWDERIPSTPAFDNVETLGYVPESELVDLYKRAAVFYFPTLHEGFGLPILEAMAAGCAVVTSDVYSVPEVTGDAAVLCPPDDAQMHARTVTELLETDRKRRELAERAIDRAGTFTWEKSATKTEAVYRSVL